MAAPRRLWVDIENPPQVQYLAPLVEVLRARGCEVLVTARDYGFTFELLGQRGIAFAPAGRHFGGALRAKVVGNLRRAAGLRRLLARVGPPEAVISASRSAAMAARLARIPSFALCDYEYVNLSVFRATGSFVVHPEVIAAETFEGRGVSRHRLIAYRGIKEDITFAGVDLGAEGAHVFSELAGVDAVRVLVRPPAEESHYHREESSALARDLLRLLAGRDDLVVVFSPRYEWQTTALHEYEWRHPPVVVQSAVSFLPLYKAVDVVVSGGGTMTREAAYLGIPAITMFRGQIGQVDRYLESVGRLRFVERPAELAGVELATLPRRGPLLSNPAACDDIVDAVFHVLDARGRLRHAPVTA
jgi:uncharacterized protein